MSSNYKRKKFKFLTDAEKAARKHEHFVKKSFNRLKASTQPGVDLDEIVQKVSSSSPYVPDAGPRGVFRVLPVEESLKAARPVVPARRAPKSSTTTSAPERPAESMKRQRTRVDDAKRQSRKKAKRDDSTRNNALVKQQIRPTTTDVDDASNFINNNDDDDNDDNKTTNHDDVANNEETAVADSIAAATDNDDNDDDAVVADTATTANLTTKFDNDPEFAAFKQRRLSEMSGELEKLKVSKTDRYATARKEYATKRMAQIEEKLRFEYSQIQKAKKNRERKSKRALMQRRTTHGQPVMSSILFNLVDKLKKDEN